MTRVSSRAIAFALLAAIGGGLMVQPSASQAGTTHSSDRISYVLLQKGGTSTTMSGSSDDLRRARALRAGTEELLYVRQDGAAYVIRDPATLRQAAAIFKPQHDLGDRQAALGDRQAALGDRQAELGDRQADLGMQQASATPARQAELGRQQGELGKQQAALGAQQAALGEQQGALGREQARAARIANQQFRVLLADAVRRGLAQRVN